ncbi:hypothetical protein DL991_31410 [Amycolatopsis sp. WAC 01375]|uniref:hypothetical protein n=1 Tax=Amycolatopsis sp. WAC 01375 TaxID=2203194 RepID=UPI000F76CB6B|nr:hypothetical protein [Amycolatopsis sp. WAC 01375]RSM73545.1 hypothetical protein DL991_31410 [Amycolatopsis sp. WAC 01375]
MQPVVVAYALYLAITVPLTVLVARTLSRHGKTFLEDVFQDKQALAHSVNQLLVVGFYLVSLGFVTLFLTSDDTVLDARDVFEMLSVKVGTVALVLGVMHVGNVLVFNGIRRKHLNHTAARPVPPPPYPGYPAPAPHPAP